MNLFQQPHDLCLESDVLYELLKNKTDTQLETVTLFKNWTVNDIIRHLHFWNYAADLSFRDEAGFLRFFDDIKPNLVANDLRSYEEKWLNGLSGQALLAVWHDFYKNMTNNALKEDPKRRVKWAGPSMSILSSITARLMETWAHGQAIFDVFGRVREDTDRIKNIVILGINTFAWTYINQGRDAPTLKPCIRLKAPSGIIWEFNHSNNGNVIEGLASEFCQVVTQTRNIGDTDLKVTGDIANEWMSMAQCFAGPANRSPKIGERHKAK